jgi:hypothetical protein
MRGRSDRIAHIVQSVEEADQVVALAGIVVGTRCCEVCPLGNARLRLCADNFTALGMRWISGMAVKTASGS